MRFQLALNVNDLDEAIEYYSKLFGTKVNKRKPGYANFAVENPPLKLVLFEEPGASERLNHVGFEMEETEVKQQLRRIEPTGIEHKVLENETCCYAEKSTVYTHDPQGLMWEFYKFKGDSEGFAQDDAASPANCNDTAAAGGCCS